jgi:hypothetical protein
MAKIVLGIGSSHAPQLAMPPDQWRAYGDRSRTQSQHWFQGSTYSFEQLVDLRREDHFENECTDEKFQNRFDACQKAIAHLGETLHRASPDVCIILGDDQHEAFDDTNMPAIAVFHGETVEDAPFSEARARRPGQEGGPGAEFFRGNVRDPNIDHQPKERISHPADATLGEHLIEALIDSEFDVTRTNQIPVGSRNGTIGHAFYYVYRRLMFNEVTPNVPVMINTYYPPNVPSPKRSYKLGQAIRQAVEAWDLDKRVAIIASGGLSHTVIEEDLDSRIIEGLKNNDVAKLTDYPDVRFRAGTSEIKNWIILAGAMAGNGLKCNVVDYVPCYRTEAGNGCAMGFAEWE